MCLEAAQQDVGQQRCSKSKDQPLNVRTSQEGTAAVLASQPQACSSLYLLQLTGSSLDLVLTVTFQWVFRWTNCPSLFLIPTRAPQSSPYAPTQLPFTPGIPHPLCPSAVRLFPTAWPAWHTRRSSPDGLHGFYLWFLLAFRVPCIAPAWKSVFCVLLVVCSGATQAVVLSCLCYQFKVVHSPV